MCLYHICGRWQRLRKLGGLCEAKVENKLERVEKTPKMEPEIIMENKKLEISLSNIDGSDDTTILQWKESKSSTLYPDLKGGIFHRTSIEGYAGIKKTGYIYVVLKLNSEKTSEKLIPNSNAPRIGDNNDKMYIPYVEAWYPEPIPFSFIESFICSIYSVKDHSLHFEQFDKAEIPEFENIQSTFCGVESEECI